MILVSLKLFAFDRNTLLHITVNYLYLEYILEAIIVYYGLLLVTWNYMTVCKQMTIIK